MPWWGDLLVAVVLLLAALGCVFPVLPGGLLALGAVLVWNPLVVRGWVGWSVLAVSVALIAIGQVVKYAWPGRRLARSDVHGVSLLVGTVLGIVAFFVIPVVGLVVGFVLGIFLSELVRTHDGASAWAGTREALKATGLSILVELASVLLVTAVWLLGVAATA